MPLKLTRHDRSAIEHQRGNIQPCQGHHGAGNRLVAAGQGHDGVEEMSARDEFDGVRNDFPTDQRSLHPFGPHGNAIGNGNGIVFDRRAAGCSDACLDPFRQAAQMVVARHDFDPGIRDADKRPRKILVGESHGFHHRAGRRPSGAVRQMWLLCLGSLGMLSSL